MNSNKFTELLAAMPEADWQALIDGQQLYMDNDLHLQIAAPGAAHAIMIEFLNADLSWQDLKSKVIEEAEELLRDYYRENFMTRKGFNHQLSALIDDHGAASFAAAAGEMPAMSVFVDGGDVVAEGPESPRYRYGAYCEVDSVKFVDNLVKIWLESGEAYQTYLSMNVCRNNC